jgi:hypothetical protein
MITTNFEPPNKANLNSTWGIKLQPAICEACDWRYLLPPQRPAQQCPHCLKAELVPLEDEHIGDLSFDYPPELLLPFTASTETLNQSIQQFAGGIWFAPGDLNPQNLKARLQRVYLPVWLVDRRVQATWQAETGFNYDVVSHRDSFDEKKGGWNSKQITETRIRWEPRLGRLNRTYHNIPAPALEEHLELVRRLGQYNLKAGQPYQADSINQALIRLPNRSPTDAWPDAIPALQTSAIEECQQAAQADHIRDFRWAPDYQDQNWTLMLLPAYMSYYLDDQRTPQPVLIHGQTGLFSGPRRASMKRAQRAAIIIAIIATVIFTLSVLVAGASFFVPPLFIVAGLGLVVAIIIGMLAIAPVIIAWQFNRTNR